MKSQYSNKIIRIAVGRKNSYKYATNKEFSWHDFCESRRTPVMSEESHYEFMTEPKENQDILKAAAGWILGGEINGQLRSNLSVLNRSTITLDCEDMADGVYESICDGTNPICDHEFFAHTTRKHTPADPRLRIFLLVTDAIDPEKYMAVSRIVASKIDPTMESIDPISFRKAQIMFNPTCSAGQEFKAFHNAGEIINPDEVLAEFAGDWRDHTKLPCAAGRDIPQTSQDSTDDPWSKEGIIGDFCRAHRPIQKAMIRFIPDVYIPANVWTNVPRWTYHLASTSNGMVVHDEGRFIYSWHSSDPCCDRLINAFDMIRIHLFGHLDGEEHLKLDMNKRPSFIKMLELCRSLPEVNEQALTRNYDIDAINKESEADDATDYKKLPFADRPLFTGKKPVKNKDWTKNLTLNQRGFIETSPHNVTTIILNDPRLGRGIARNAFTNKIVARHDIKTNAETTTPIIVTDKKNGDDWQDIFDIILQLMLNYPKGKGKTGWGIHASKGLIANAVRAVAEVNQFNPVIDYHNTLEWDGTKRIHRLWIDYMGTPDNAYYRETATLFMLASICRIYNPGHKWDHAPILEGAQGIRKSSFVQALFSREWSGELTALMVSDKNAVEQMLGKQCLELPELSNMRKAESEDVKAFITREIDEVRLAYDKRMTKFPRCCIFIGTTNASEYLKDPTGNRRFWPIQVKVDQIDTGKLMRERDQLTAEAVAMFKKREKQYGNKKFIPLVLSPEAREFAEEMQDKVREMDSSEMIADSIQEWLEEPIPLNELMDKETMHPNPLVLRVKTTPTEIAKKCGNLTNAQIFSGKNPGISIGMAFTKIDNWGKPQERTKSGKSKRSRFYTLKDATEEELEQGYRIVAQEPNPEF